MASEEEINNILRNIRINSPDVIGAVVISIDGLPIASVAPDELDEELAKTFDLEVKGRFVD